MTLSEIQSKIYALTGTDSTSYPNANMLIDINLWYQKVGGMILDSQDEADFDDQRRTDYPIKTIVLTTNRDYSIPVTEKMLKMKDLSISYDGATFYRATPLNGSELNQAGTLPSSSTTANATLDSYFSTTSPRYSLKWNSIFIYPIATAANVAAGGTMIAEWYRQINPFTSAELTDGTPVPGFDDTFHAMLAYGPSFEYCEAKTLPQAKTYSDVLQDYEMRLRKQYSQKQNDRRYALTSDYQSYK